MTWAMASVGEIAKQIRGVSYSKGEARATSAPGFKPIIRANNITDNGLLFADLVYVPQERISEKQYVRAGDIIIAASSGSLDVVGKASQAREDFDGAFGAFCKLVRPSRKVDAGFVGHFFKTQDYRRRVSALAAGANINNLRNEHIDEMPIPLPLLEEQRRIAAILDNADALRQKRRAALQKLDALTQSIFLEMFGDPTLSASIWPVHPIGELDLHISDGNYSSKYPTREEFVDAGIPFVKANNIEDLTLTDNGLRFITPAKHRELKKGHLVEGDVLITTRGEIGKVAIVPPAFNGANINAQIVLLRPTSSQINFRYLAHLLNLPQMKAHFRGYQNGVALQQLPIHSLTRVPLPVPPPELQSLFASRTVPIENLRLLLSRIAH